MRINAFILRRLINAAGLFVATKLIAGIQIAENNYWFTLLVVALIFGVINALVKPILALLTCPLYILTLGLFTFVVNALMLVLTSAIAEALNLGFHVNTFFWDAIGGAIIISIVSFLLSHLVPDRI